MNYTMEEKQQMVKCIEQIEEFIKTQVMPNIREKIEVGFGGTYYNQRSWPDTVNNYHIGVYPDEKFIGYGHKYGGNNIPFMKDDEAIELANNSKWYWWKSCCSDKVEDGIYNNCNDMQAFIENWHEIKRGLLAEVQKQTRKITSIQNFSL